MIAQNNPGPIIGFAGLTHLGLCSSAAAAAKGCQVRGFDPDDARIRAINALTPEVHEPDLVETLTAHQAVMRFSTDPAVLSICDLVYISTDVPTDDHGIADVRIVHHLIALVQPHLRDDCVLVVLCQVSPGFTRAIKRSDPYLVYQVETLVFGQAMHRALKPERFIIGLSDGKAPVPAVLKEFLGRFDCPVLPMTFESAELTKIAINCCLAASVSVANTLSELAEEIGADWREIAPALKLDRRIGAYAYLSPGLGLAGGNIERDLAAVINMGAEFGTHTRVIEAFVENSRHRAQWCLRALHDRVFSVNANAVVAFWGLAYKEDTRSVKNAPSLSLAKALTPYRLQVYDPMVTSDVLDHPDAVSSAQALDALKGADVLVVLTPWAEFKAVTLDQIQSAFSGSWVIDPFGVLSALDWTSSALTYVTMGRGPRLPISGVGTAPC